LRAEIDRVISAITAVGHSDALIATLREKEGELRDLSAAKDVRRALDPDEIRQFVETSVQDVPKLLKKSPQLAKAKLHQHVDSIRLQPQPDGTYVAQGVWDLLGNRGPVMVAGEGFEPSTFGL
jgi:hypothetical protein